MSGPDARGSDNSIESPTATDPAKANATYRVVVVKRLLKWLIPGRSRITHQPEVVRAADQVDGKR
jgi:hypothetical protein